MRKELQQREGKRGEFTAVFQRFGSKPAYRGPPIVTLLLVDVRDSVENIVADHLWFKTALCWERANLKPGDVVKFEARVQPYWKVYRGSRGAEDDGGVTLDYGLKFPSNVRVMGAPPPVRPASAFHPMNYCNNLRKDDVVQHVETKRPGKVAWNPRESSRFVSVIWQGTHAAQSVDVMKLRLVVNGVAEDVPPIDGEPPALRSASAVPRDGLSTHIEALKKDRQDLTDEMTDLEARFKATKAQRERVDQAIAVLEPKA